jgi:hypothetical protein
VKLRRLTGEDTHADADPGAASRVELELVLT